MIYIDVHTHDPKTPGPKIFVITDLNQITPTQLQDYFCLGIHPWFINDYSLPLLAQALERLHSHPSFVALGEIGLDRAKPNFNKQMEIFEAQVELAKKFNIGRLVLHCVRSQSDMVGKLLAQGYEGKLLWHGLNPTPEDIEQLCKHAWESYFGVGHLIFGQAKIGRNLPLIPPERLLLETDSQTKYPIQAIYAQAAELLGRELPDFAAQIEQNFQHFLSD